MSGKFVGAEQRDPQLPTSVLMPSAVADITDAGMRATWETAGLEAAGRRPHFSTLSFGGRHRAVNRLHP